MVTPSLAFNFDFQVGCSHAWRQKKGTGYSKGSGDTMKKAMHDEKRIRAYQKILRDVHWRFQTYKELGPK